MNLLEAIQSSYLSRGLSSGQIEKLLAISRVEVHQMDDQLVKANEQNHDLMILVTGRVSITTLNGDVIAEIGPGSLLGEISLVDQDTRSASANCLEETEVLVLPGDKLRRLMEEDMKMAARVFLNIASVLASRLRATNVHLGHLLDPTQNFKTSSDIWSF